MIVLDAAWCHETGRFGVNDPVEGFRIKRRLTRDR